MPSTEPTKSSLMASPFCAGRGGSTGFCSRLALAMRSIASSTSLSGTLAFRRSSSTPEKSSLPISGSTSIATSNSTSLPSSSCFRSTRGCSAGFSPRSSIALAVLELTACSTASPIQRLAVLLLQQTDRHLARPEARQRRRLGQFGQALVDLGRQVAGGDDDLELPLQPFGREFRHLHFLTSTSVWCGRRDLNPHALRHENLNLACLPIPPRPPDVCPIAVEGHRGVPRGPNRGPLSPRPASGQFSAPDDAQIAEITAASASGMRPIRSSAISPGRSKRKAQSPWSHAAAAPAASGDRPWAISPPPCRPGRRPSLPSPASPVRGH